jgi:hypothetical protein
MQWKRVERQVAASVARSTSGRSPSADLTGAAFRPVVQPAGVQPLEPRTLFSVSLAFDGLMNVSKNPFNQSETAVAINPTNPNNVFTSANHGAFLKADTGPDDPIAETGIFTSVTTDGGVTWTPKIIGTDNDGNDISDDGFPIACCDPSAAYDDFGNLFFVYLAGRPGEGQGSSIAILLSTDGGVNFTHVISFRGGGSNPLDPADTRGGLVDRCEVATGRNPDGTVTVAVSFVDFDPTVDAIQTVMAPVSGLGVVGTWNPVQSLPQSGTGNGGAVAHNLADVQVGPSGQVVTAHQEVGNNPVDRIYVNPDLDGLGPAPFGNAIFIDNSQLTFFEPLPSQPVRGVAAVPTLAYDNSSGPHRGRLYLAYAQAVTEQRVDELGLPQNITTDSNILLRFSDNNGGTWSPAIRVNDDPVSSIASQFFQRVAVDPVTGNVAVGWLDTRDDPSGSNQEAGYYVTVGQPAGNGVDFSPNIRLNVGLSNARFSGNFGNDYGDYTGIDFYNNVLWAAYPDNSNSTGDNPSGRWRAFDIYAARVRVTDTTVPLPPLVTPASPLSPTVAKPQSLVKKGKFYQLKVTYSHPSGINLATVGNDDVVVTGPNGFSQPMTLVKAKPKKKGTVVQATYRLAAPGGTWDAGDNGVYTAVLQQNSVASNDNSTTTTSGTVTNFLVNAKAAGKKGKAEPAAAPVIAVPPSTFSESSVLPARKDDEALLA